MTFTTAERARLLLIVAAMAALALVDDRVVNVSTYEVEPLSARCAWLQRLAPILAAAVVIWTTRRRRAIDHAHDGDPSTTAPPSARTAAAWLAALAAAVVAWTWVLLPPAAGGYALLLAALILISLAVVALDDPDSLPSPATAYDCAPLSAASSPSPPPSSPCTRDREHRVAMLALLGAIVLSTAWHTWTQIVLWRHFAFGYADIGLFITELENCLPFKDVGPGRFATTRMGFHCIPMFYALAPLYAVIRSPVFLMTTASAALNVAAWPFARLARMRSGSAWTGLVVGLSWLAVPSVSRVPYANTYGFQSIDLAVPWLAWMLCLWFSGRRRLSHVCLIGAMLCEETVCGVALGWGLYLALVERRRREGVVILLAAIGYLLLCTGIVIPAFDAAGRYSRIDLFGELNAAALFERLTRAKTGWYVATLLAPLAAVMWRRARLLLVCAPTLLLVLLLKNADYLSIKYWHQCSVLPVLFTAATLGATARRDGRGIRDGVGDRTTDGSAGDVPSRTPGRDGVEVSCSSPTSCAALLVGALLAHQWLGFSPLAHAFRPMAADASLAVVDPRESVVQSVYERFDPSRTHVIATERLAAHFTRYRTVRSTPNVDFESLPPGAFVLIADRADRHDRVVSGGELDALLEAARRQGFKTWREEGEITILSREAP